MGIMRVGASAGAGSTITIPTHKVGDLIVIFAFRDGSVTNPTIPAGFTNITNTLDGTSCSASVGYKFATTNAETSGTWTNATHLVVVVYRGIQAVVNPFGTATTAVGTTNTVNYGARALANSNVIGSSWFLSFAAHVNVDTTIDSVLPTGLSLVTSFVDATSEVVALDTNGPATANWPSTNASISGTAGAWVTFIIEMKAQGLKFNNYQFIKAGNGMSTGEKLVY